MRSIFRSLFGGGATKRVVEIQPLGVTIETTPGQTILEAALAQGVAYPHNCTVGTCGSCKTRLRQGTVQASSDFGYTLSRQELEAGYILACQAATREPLTVVEIAAPAADLRPAVVFDARIVSTEALTHDILKVVVQTDRPVMFVAGQYASFTAPGLPRSRNYSFADAPQRAGRTSLSFFIRKVSGGAFTGALFDGALTGKPLKLEAAHGAFHLRPGAGPMVCIAGGSGLAPLRSVLEDMRMRRVRRPCVLLFGARTQADLYALDSIHGIANSWGESFAFVPVLSEEPPSSDWGGARGFVTDAIAQAGTAVQWPAAQAYLCGPPPMIDSGIDRLVELGVPLDSIFYDKFTDGAAGPATEA
jgi:p-cymene monooxygenase electron transfer component